VKEFWKSVHICQQASGSFHFLDQSFAETKDRRNGSAQLWSQSPVDINQSPPRTLLLTPSVGSRCSLSRSWRYRSRHKIIILDEADRSGQPASDDVKVNTVTDAMPSGSRSLLNLSAAKFVPSLSTNSWLSHTSAPDNSPCTLTIYYINATSLAKPNAMASRFNI